MERKKACHLVEKNLIDIAENHLDKETLQRVQEHLDGCDRCALLCQEFSIAWQNTAPQETPTLSPLFFSDLMKRVAAYDEKSSRWRDFFIPLRRFLRPAVTALLLMAGIFAGYELGNIVKNGPRPDDSLAGQIVGSFEDIPKGSLADFYIGRQLPKKTDTK